LQNTHFSQLARRLAAVRRFSAHLAELKIFSRLSLEIDMTAALLALVLLALLALFAIAAKRNISRQTLWQVYAKRILSNPEQALFGRLVRACPNHQILAQVALSQMIGAKKGERSRAMRNRYAQLVADFLICRKDFSIEAVVELDDSSHKRGDRQRADLRKSGVLEAAGIRLVRLSVAELPDEQALARMLFPTEPSARAMGSPQ
jgi:very-short-patch-repair endonuclease